MWLVACRLTCDVHPTAAGDNDESERQLWNYNNRQETNCKHFTRAGDEKHQNNVLVVKVGFSMMFADFQRELLEKSGGSSKQPNGTQA